MAGSLLERLKRYATAFLPYCSLSFGLRRHCRMRFGALISANNQAEWAKLVLPFPPSCHKRGKRATPSQRVCAFQLWNSPCCVPRLIPTQY